MTTVTKVTKYIYFRIDKLSDISYSRAYQSCSFSFTWAGESYRWASVSSCIIAVTVHESGLGASALELFSPLWSLYVFIEFLLEF